MSPARFRDALREVPPAERDAWIDAAFGLGEIPEDDPLPRGCVPYLPCAVATILDAIEHARIGPDDVFVDIGAGVGRALAIVHRLTGAGGLGIEIQPRLVQQARALIARLEISRVAILEGDAAEMIGHVATGTVFFLYCPFGGERLAAVLARLEALARTRRIRVCAVDLPLPACPWLAPVAQPSPDLVVYRSAR